jgi:hypothetical protein
VGHIPKGMRFRVINRAEKYDLEVSPDRELWTLVDLENYVGGGSMGGLRESICWNVKGYDEATTRLFLELVDALEPAPKRIDVYCYDRGMDLDDDASDLIVSMVRNGMLSWRALEQAIELMKEDRKDPERELPVFGLCPSCQINPADPHRGTCDICAALGTLGDV